MEKSVCYERDIPRKVAAGPKVTATRTTLFGGQPSIIEVHDAPPGSKIEWTLSAVLLTPPGTTTSLCPAVSMVPLPAVPLAPPGTIATFLPVPLSPPGTTARCYTAPAIIPSPCIVTVSATVVVNPNNITPLSVDIRLQPPNYEFDWGRVRAYFTTGVLLSKDQGDFSKSNLFISFNLDKNWLQWVRLRSQGWRLRLNTYFDARLTAVPETTNSTTPATAAAQASQIVNSAKAASLQGGLYVPVTAAQWTFNRDANALFIGPLVKVGFNTAIDTASGTSVVTTSVTNPADGSLTLKPSVIPIAPLHPDRFYKFYGYGVRLGHFKDSHDPDVAPEIISYIDIVYGRFANFDLLPDGTAPNKGTARPYRYGIEGILKIPQTPFIIGMSANVSGSGKPGYFPGKDDLRFLFGVKFDVGKLFARLGVPGIL